MEGKYDKYKPKLEKIIQIIGFVGALLFLVSPLMQLIERVIIIAFDDTAFTGKGIGITAETLMTYQNMTRSIEEIVVMLVRTLLAVLLIYVLMSPDKVKAHWKGCLKAAVPLMIFGAYSAGIYIVTQIRGYGEFDLIPQFYLGENMYDFMRYPFTYFVCGMFVIKSSHKKLLMYIFTLSASIVNTVAMVDDWVTPLKLCAGYRRGAVFNNTNHYCYYLAIVIVCSAMLCVYEEKMLYKVFNGANMALASAAMISADTLGTDIAVLLTLIMFIIYCWRNEKNRLKSAVAVLLIFIAVSGMLASLVDSFIWSIVHMFIDIGNVVADPQNSDDAGSGRIRLCKEAMEHISRRPLVGWGVEGYEYGGTAHCEPLQYAVNFGLPVMILYIAAVSVVMIETFIKKKKLSKMTLLCFCCSTSYLISSLLGVAIFYTTPFLYVFLGLTYAEVGWNMILKSEKSETVTESGENAE